MSVGKRDASKVCANTSRHSLRIVNVGKAFLIGTQLIYQFENVKKISAYRRFNVSETCLSSFRRVQHERSSLKRALGKLCLFNADALKGCLDPVVCVCIHFCQAYMTGYSTRVSVSI